MKQAINPYEAIATSEVFREQQRLMDKARHDEIGILNYARDEGREEGREKNLIDNIKSLMETVHWTAQQAMNALRIPETEHQRYLDMLAAQQGLVN